MVTDFIGREVYKEGRGWWQGFQKKWSIWQMTHPFLSKERSCWYSEKMLTQVTIHFRQISNLSLERDISLKITQIEHTGTDFTFKNGIR